MHGINIKLGNDIRDQLDATIMTNLQSISSTCFGNDYAHLPAPQDSSQQHQVLETICSNIRSSAPEDGHNDSRNMLS